MSRKLLIIILLACMVLVISIVIKVEALQDSWPAQDNLGHQIEKVIPPKDITLSKWELATSSATWSARDAHSLTAFKDALWLIGGLEGNGTVRPDGVVEYWKAPHKTDIWRSEDGINWNLIRNDAPWGHRRSVSTVVFNDKLWVMGGWDNMHTGYNSRVWNSDDGIIWTEVPQYGPTWPPREGQVTLVHNNKIWLMGGVNFSTRTGLNDVWYSEDGSVWQQATEHAPWGPRYDHAATEFNGKIYVTGGKPVGDGNTFRDIWSTADGSIWNLETENADWPSRHGHISVTYKNKIWVIGGWHVGSDYDGAINDTWFSEDALHWKKIKQTGPWTGREDHMGEVFRNKIWLTGGMDANLRWSNDVWYLEE